MLWTVTFFVLPNITAALLPSDKCFYFTINFLVSIYSLNITVFRLLDRQYCSVSYNFCFHVNQLYSYTTLLTTPPANAIVKRSSSDKSRIFALLNATRFSANRTALRVSLFPFINFYRISLTFSSPSTPSLINTGNFFMMAYV